ncbi:methionine--tRNA ligase [Paenibacillus sp. Marseille-Q4541]|uniref:methionine--tRNA ligase n=1 Tax=Paenibacillus sp. Marseille-Q4541 TaxID=2831522 RepID=UPI001BAE427B|nr:methionine--tRNA ligase [Paenibacillus sp. Marseille-Q4541]
MNVFIGGAWPYANGSLHLGRVSGLLTGDVIARFYRLTGEKVLYVSGSDCHGTPISLQANKEGVSPKSIADRYHEQFRACFTKLGFSYDFYTRTDDPFHAKVVQSIFLELLEKKVLYKKAVEQTYCINCDRFLPDRYVEGNCPHCGNIARGDQCDSCSSILDPLELHHRVCKLCNETPITRLSDHYFLSLSSFQDKLDTYLSKAEGWRENAIHLTARYLEEGLQDRAVTRDIDLGIDVPLEDGGGKKIYVWIEAIIGYLSASKQWAEEQGDPDLWKDFWSDNEVKSYYVHGKDNIPFHTLLWPALLLGLGDLHLPDHILSSEYLTLEGKKFSTSNNWAVWVPYILDHYDPDAVRYFLIANGPENRDTDFSWREFIYSHNGELLGAFGNFVHRNLVFVNKVYNDRIPAGNMEASIQNKLEQLYINSGELIKQGRLKEALESIFSLIRSCNKYVDEQKPWVQVKEDTEACKSTLFTCVQVIVNLSVLLEPFLPFASNKIRQFFDLPASDIQWGYTELFAGHEVGPIEVLFQRIDVKQMEIEVEKLKAAKGNG